ncbi:MULTISPECIES: DNA polymerase III [unclassified Pasteurella]|uniref:DNA polymerase III n=1 Tax=unclassified Pasteurella TaxID=2621516 RepID=UPI001074515E|nr:DNA polymerase III [Pasteurella sp. 19428wF3_WM03]TFU50986.1 DNA polymerase III [Pasteurella sp. WM03]
MSNFILYDYAALLSANPNKWWQDYIINSTNILFKFLYKENLISVFPFDESGNVIENFILNSCDVDSACIELFRKSVPNWRKAHDRGTPIEKITILEKGLAKIRNASSLK